MHLAMCAQKSVFSLVKSGKYINVFIPAQKAPSDGDLGHCLLPLVEGKHDCTGEIVQHHVPSTAVTCAVFENVVEIC